MFFSRLSLSLSVMELSFLDLFDLWFFHFTLFDLEDSMSNVKRRKAEKKGTKTRRKVDPPRRDDRLVAEVCFSHSSSQ